MAQLHSRRNVVAAAAALGASLGFPSLAFAQGTFPDKSKTIRGIVPLSAGSTVDVLARVYAQQMSEILGTNVIIDNRPGAEYLIGLQAVKAAPADGYTILFSSNSLRSCPMSAKGCAGWPSPRGRGSRASPTFQR